MALFSFRLVASRGFPRSIQSLYYSTHDTFLHDAHQTVTKKTNDELSAVKEDQDLSEAAWPPASEATKVDESLVNADARQFLTNGKVDEFEQIHRAYDSDNDFHSLSVRIRDFVQTTTDEDPVAEALHGLGMNRVSYRRGLKPQINWDFYKKNLGADFVNDVKKSYEQTLADSEKYVPAATQEIHDLTASLEGFFTKQIAAYQSEAKIVLAEIDRIEAQQAETLQLGSRLAHINVEEDLAGEEKDLHDFIENGMVNGLWTVEDEDIPDAPASATDNSFQAALERSVEQVQADRAASEAATKKAVWV